MKSLLVVAHGSRRAESNEEVRQLTGILREKAGNRFLSVECSFLEITPPSISEGLDSCVNKGAKTIVILPYFLSMGRHVMKDIPEQVALKQQQFPEIKMEIAPYLGSATAIPELMLSLLPT